MLRRALRPLQHTYTRTFTSTTRIMAARVQISVDYQLEDGKMKEIPFPKADSESKILLSKVSGKYYATSSKCTHYGAPLVKGVLTSSGRIVCPWHGACFNACTGDIEDAPGLNNLSSFKVEEEGSALFITPPESADVTATREPPAFASSKSGKGVVIVGGGAGAAHAVEELREAGYEGRIRVVSSESYLPIDRTKLSKALIPDASKIALRSAEFYEKLGVEFLLGQEASSIDFEADTLALKTGDKIEYEQLIVATGASPNRLPVDGANLENIFVLRTVEHSADIDKAIGDGKAEKKNVVVIGSSFIGMEAALAASSRANVTVVGMEGAPFQAILGKEIGNGVRKFHESKGTKFFLPASLSHFEPSSSSKAVGSVILKDGTSIPADVVILGVGVKPATSVLKESGVQLEKDGSVKTDEFLRIGGEGMVKGNVFAIGDIAKYRDVKTGQDIRVEHWNVASNHARAVARTIALKGAAFEKVAVFWSAQGQQLRYAGTARSKEWEDVIIKGNPDELKFVAYYTTGDDVVAVASMQNDPIAAHVSELFRLDKMLSAKEIKAGKNPLDIPLSA
ncbi:flavo protein [Leucosporidium creatinivorum]|uniref:Flavo protein n=1 Tax=Leucosporidium creatinivorum TaxID=106004 RepID=A0A1Y2FYL1_9BASI|nr:flavo protein [Leucosporidium creatinivorum]